MSERARQRAMTAALNAIAREQADTQRYQDKQSQARSGGMADTAGARPLEFDESGFPIRQNTPNFVQRVARLLNPR